MKKMIKFTDIGQFRNTVSDISRGVQTGYYKDYPTLNFIGTTKLHGTNSGVCYTKEDGIWVQSRNRVISVQKDNAGFAFFVESRKHWFEEIMQSLYKENYIITIFGEYCGGNIQKGVALCELSKRFVIFSIKYTNIEDDGDHWYEIPKIKNEELDIYNIYDNKFPKYGVSIDFHTPEKSQNKMIKLVEEVEKECPFAKAFGISGIGEGIVFSSFDESGKRTHIFKVKGEKHSSSKVKTLASVDIEKVNNIIEFIEYAVTENRLNQGIEQVFYSNSEPINVSKTGDFLRWVVNDIIKEELDTMVKNGLEPKDVGKYISNKARPWFFQYMEDLKN
jgi:hypothetical protein